MARKILSALDLGRNELLNARIQNLANAPSSPVVGQQYFDTTLGKYGVYNGATWDYMGTSTATGDVSSNTATSVDGEVALFSGTGGKTIKRATGTGNARLTNGVLGTGTVLTTEGGTGITSYAVGDILFADTTTSLAKLAAAATGNVLISNGAGSAPSYGKIGLTTHVTGTLPIANGGTGTNSLPTGLLKGAGTGAITAATQGTDYYAPGGTDIALADGGTGASTAAGARTNLGLVIGTDVLAPNGNGSALTGITQSQVQNLTTDLAAKAPLASPTFTGTVTVPTPTNATDAANKGYVDNAVQGLSWKQAVRVATTGNITLSGAQTIDGIAIVAGDRVLVKGQTTASANGIYVVSASAWARSTDTDSSAEIDSMTVYVESGTANADTVWTLTTDNPTLGSTSLAFAQINGGATPTASTTTEGKVELATTAETEAKSDTTRAVTPASLATFARKFTGLIGDGSATSFAVTHGLGSQWVTAQLYDAATNEQVETDIVLTSATQTTFTFATAPATNAYRVVITG